MNRTQLAAGDVVKFIVTVHNPSSKEVVIHGSSSCILGVEVRNAGAEVVAPIERICTMDLAEFRIAAHGQITRTFDWNGSVDFGHGARLPQGTYRANGLLQSSELKKTSASRAIVVAAS